MLLSSCYPIFHLARCPEAIACLAVNHSEYLALRGTVRDKSSQRQYLANWHSAILLSSRPLIFSATENPVPAS